ncbi:terminase large subunit [Mesorhizobium sp. M1300]
MNSVHPSSALLQQLSKLSPEKRADLLADVKERLSRVRLAGYAPYSKQAAFHEAGARYRERLFRAGNQLGKTVGGGAEAAYHLTGKYPVWWKGRRWDRPTHGWVGGVTGLSVRDAPQKILLGRAGSVGTGMIPMDDIAGYTHARSVADLVDTIRVRHVSGGISTASFKSYESGREKWQAETLDWVWFDEEPPEDIYTEGLTRTNATGGMSWLTFTPLLGMSSVVKRFLSENSQDRHDTVMTIEDAEHIPAAERQKIINSYPAHEQEARVKGIPILGSGRIFPVLEADITEDPFHIPRYWPRLGAMDFGWDHPFAAVEIVYDTEGDVVHIVRSYRVREQSPAIHAIALRPWGAWLPWSWPRDGRRETLEGAGQALAKQFGVHGLSMLGTHAQFSDGSVSVEAGLMDMLDRMQTGRFKVFKHLNDWFEEFRLYHRKDGRVEKIGDDLMSASRYGVMMLREAIVNPAEFKSARRSGAQSDPLAGFR